MEERVSAPIVKGEKRREKDKTHNPSSDRHAKHERGLACPRQGSNLYVTDFAFNLTSLECSIESELKRTRIEQDQTIRTDQIDTTSTSFRTQQEDEGFSIWIVELVDQLLSFVRIHRSIESE